MNLTRGTTPQITINIKDDIDLSKIQSIWVYISQSGKVKVDKLLADVSINADDKQITVRLEQEDTLALKAGEALFQVRLLLNDNNALATPAYKVTVSEIYKGGVIE